MTNLLINLPDEPGLDAATDWWLVADGAIVERGRSEQWLALARSNEMPIAIIGLAPAARVRMAFVPYAEGVSSDQQAIAVARVEAVNASLGDKETLHAAGALIADGRATLVALVANDAMLQWLGWANRLDVALDHIVPSALVLPLGEEWIAAGLGSERVAGRHGLVIPAEPALIETLAAGDEMVWLTPEAVETSLAALAAAPLIDLRSGRFAKRKRFVIDRARIRELVMLAAAIPLIALLYGLMQIARLDQSTRRLDAEALAAAQSVAGSSVTLDTAAAALAARSSSQNVFAVPLGALLVHIQAQPNLSATQMAYASDGTFSTTLAAPGADPINRVLLALQRDGYQITAVRRQGADGRLMADVTIRSGS